MEYSRGAYQHSDSPLPCIIGGGVLLLAGCLFYLLFRSEHIRLYQWAVGAGAGDAVGALRTVVGSWPMPDAVRYSLPDLLFSVSYILIMHAVWRRQRRLPRLVMVSLMPAVAAAHELAQLAGLARGTFDIVDLACYLLPLVVYYLYQYLFNP